MNKAKKMIVTGIIILVVGASLVPVIIVPIFLERSDSVQFVIPGQVEFETKNEGRYYLWNDFRTIYEGQTYNNSSQLPNGLKIKLEDLDKNQKVNLVNSGGMTFTTNGKSSQSIGYIDVKPKTKLLISVQGECSPQVFSFSQSVILEKIAFIIGMALLACLMSIIGFIIIILGVIKQSQSKKEEKPKSA